MLRSVWLTEANKCRSAYKTSLVEERPFGKGCLRVSKGLPELTERYVATRADLEHCSAIWSNTKDRGALP
ncbi:MAG: hypothetical protein AAFQ53_03225 [Bacteroidota bacterium]